MPIPAIRIVIAGVDELSAVLNRSVKGIKKMGQSMRNIGMQMTLGLTVPIGIFGASILQTAGDFEASMNRVQNLTKATITEFKVLENQARELGATTAFSASEAAQAMGFLGMAGFETNQILSAMPSTLNLAAASGMELAEAADIMSNILTGYNKQASESSNVTDVLVTAMQSANTNLEQLGDAMKFVAPVASGLGVDFKEATAAIGLLSNAGIQGAMAGTNLRGVLSALAKPTTEAAATLERLRIPKDEIFDATGNIKSLTSIIKAFEKSGASTNDMMSIFNQRIGPAMMAMVSQGSGAMTKLIDKLEEAGGAAQDAAETQMKGFNGQLKALSSAFDELKIAIADSGLLKFATDFIIKLSDLLRKIAKFNPVILKWGTIIAGLVFTIGPFFFLIGTGLLLIAKFTAAIATAGGVIALLSNPIGWIVAGVIALGGILTWLATHTESKLTKIVIAFNPLVGLWVWVASRWKRFLPFVRLFVFGIIELIKLLVKILKPALDPLINVFSFIGDTIFKSLDKILDVIERLSRIVLPEWLERKIGLTGGVSGFGSVEALQSRGFTAMKADVENRATLRFENAPPGLRVETATPGMEIETDTGMLLPEAG